MILWIRSKPADFADILAELERGQAPEPSEPVVSAQTDDTARNSEPAPDTAAPYRRRLSRVLCGLAWHRQRDDRVAGAQAAAYAGDDAEPYSTRKSPSVESPRDIVPRLLETESESIAKELGLMRHLTKAELLELRRDFAKKNHPDRCAPAQRPRSARRMSIANMLIDAALKQTQRPG